jgi:hypothetical protein
MRAVLVFCEGNHDVAFVTRSLGALAGCEFVDKAIKELPTPLSARPNPKNPNKPIYRGIIAERYEGNDDRKVEDRRLRGAAHAPPPTFEALVKDPVEGTLYVLLRSSGKDAASEVRSLVDRMWSLMSIGSDLESVAMAVILDADDQGVEGCEAAFSSSYAPCFESGSAGAPRHTKWAPGMRGPVGLFVFHDPSSSARTGTIEDVLAPLVHEQWPEKWAGADAYLRRHVEPTDRIKRGSADHKKAQIGVTGQFMFPGSSMTAVIGNRRRGLSRERFTGPVSRALVEFLRGVPW